MRHDTCGFLTGSVTLRSAIQIMIAEIGQAALCLCSVAQRDGEFSSRLTRQYYS